MVGFCACVLELWIRESINFLCCVYDIWSLIRGDTMWRRIHRILCIDIYIYIYKNTSKTKTLIDTLS